MRELLQQDLARFLLVHREVWDGLHQRTSNHGADVEVVEFAEPLATGALHGRPHRGEVPLLSQPEAELRLGILLGPVAGPEENGENRFANAVIAAQQRAGGGDGGFSKPCGLCVKFAKLCLDLVRQAATGETTGSRAVVEGGVHPKMGEHLEQVRLAAAEEAADPSGLLSRGPQVRQIAVEDALDGVFELTSADEGLKFCPEFGGRPLVYLGANLRLAIVGKSRSARVAVEELVDLHGNHSRLPSSGLS